ncbi:MAG: hypothetical protein C0501_21715 [Isosphaera sp.]|nr:hypothetical protein [Isosphaera sp.]
MARATAALSVLLLAAGCGGGGADLVKPTVRLTLGGQPFRPAPGELVDVSLVSAGGESFPTRAGDAPDVFVVDGPDGKGVPAGAYKVAVRAVLYKPDDPRHLRNRFDGAYDPDRTPLACTVAPGAEVVVDLPAPKK